MNLVNKTVQLHGQHKESALKVLDELRADIESGKIIGFVVAGIDIEDGTYEYVSTTQPVSRLRLMGALHYVLWEFTRSAYEST